MTETNLLDALPEHVLEAIRVHQEAAAKQRARTEERVALRNRLGEVRSVVGDALPAHSVEALLIRADAIAAQNRASELLREADLVEHRAALGARVETLETALINAQAEETALAAAADKARKDEERALSRLATARENLTVAEKAEKAAARSGNPEKETEALLRVGAAGTVVQRHQAAAEGAISVRVEAENAAATARELISTAQTALEDAKNREEHAPDTLKPSVWTVTADLQKVVASGQPLDAEAMGVARLLITGYAQVIGGVIEPAVAFAVERARLEGEASRAASGPAK